jgi:hypothetical protein
LAASSTGQYLGRLIVSLAGLLWRHRRSKVSAFEWLEMPGRQAEWLGGFVVLGCFGTVAIVVGVARLAR